MKILIKFASRSRKDKLFNCLDNIISTIGIEDYIILCTLDVDDVAMANQEVNERIKSYGDKVKAIYGFSKSKIDAINRDIWIVDKFDVLLNHSDDFHFIKQDWGKDVLEAFEGYSGLVHFPDQIQKELCTYAMMSKDFYDKLGYIYHPDYESVYCDHDQQNIAKRLNSYKLVDKQILEHRHAIWGWGEADELLKKTENPLTYAKDKETYERRLNNNYYL